LGFYFEFSQNGKCSVGWEGKEAFRGVAEAALSSVPGVEAWLNTHLRCV
jgi:hypothetical protein